MLLALALLLVDCTVPARASDALAELLPDPSRQLLDRHQHPVVSSSRDAPEQPHAGLDQPPKHKSSPLEADRVNRNLAATALTHDLIETPHAALRRKSTYSQPIQPHHDPEHHRPARRDQLTGDPFHDLVSTDASAISAAAPDLSVVATSPRRLEDWEVEDFVLLATIDGDLYAIDRKSGRKHWHVSLGQPMVETVHHRLNRSAAGADLHTLDHTIWSVEPTRDGQIYMWAPGEGQGLVHTGLSMKRLVEAAPYKNEALSLVYTGEKKTSVLTLDAASGRAMTWFGPSGSAADDLTCARPHDPVTGLDVEECNTRTITLGRTEYTVSISDARGFQIATLKYAEWGPNLFDQDLLGQYSSTMDKLYITSRPDGRAYAFEYGSDGHVGRSQSFVQYFPSPIARAFDVVKPIRPSAENLDDNPQLVALPQPPPPPAFEHLEPGRDSKIFLNNTGGNWFAMSGRAYPLITQAPAALINQAQWWEMDGDFSTAHLSKALVGQHTLDGGWSKPGQAGLLTLPGPQDAVSPKLDSPSDPDNPTSAADAPDPSSTVIEIVKKLPQDALQHTTDLFTNPAIWLIAAVLLVVYRKEVVRNIKNVWRDSETETEDGRARKGFKVDFDSISVEPSKPEGHAEGETVEKDKAPAETVAAAPVDPVAPPPSTELQDQVVPARELVVPATIEDGLQTPPEPVKKKKKAHRGKRAGKNHRKKISPDTSIGDVASHTVDEAVDLAKNIGERSRTLEPNIQTLPYQVENVDTPILRIDESLQVNEDEQLGTGSNGTVVYAGKWQDRPVAVKRMLRDFYDIASQETRLLREVDRHQNVIQYFAQLERGQFIYIALELCEASLADVMDKPLQFPTLAQAGKKDPLAVLKQITHGLDHLHSLQIGKPAPCSTLTG